MRTLSYIVVFVAFLAGPSMAGSPDRDMPGIGTFVYCGITDCHARTCAHGGDRPVNYQLGQWMSLSGVS